MNPCERMSNRRRLKTKSWIPFDDDDDHDDSSSDPLEAEETNAEKKSRFRLRFGYGCGHAQNDLCSAMYFSYLLVYLAMVGLSPVDAGIVLIVGQLVDGIATPIVGSLSDRIHCGCRFAGRRNSWYIAGLVLVSSTFWMLFTPYPQGIPPVVYYSIANGLFQVGWATVQVSTMVIVPELTPVLSERTVLNSIRFAVTVGTSITIYVLVWAFSATSSGSNEGDTLSSEETERQENKQGDEEMLVPGFQIISYIVLLVGALLGLVYIWLVREKDGESSKRSSLASYLESDDAPKEKEQQATAKSYGDWFLRTRGFYGVTANYTLTRVCVNSLQVYLPFFAIYNMPDHPSAVATVPLTAFVGMCLSSILAPKFGSLITDAAKQYVAGTVCLIVGAAILFFLSETSDSWVYVASALLGIGSATTMVTSQTQVGELVGRDTNGGVVFGISALGDKVSTGIVIFVLQRFAEQTVSGEGLAELYRIAASVVPAGSTVLGLLALVSVPKNIRDRQRFEEESDDIEKTDHFDVSSLESGESNEDCPFSTKSDHPIVLQQTATDLEGRSNKRVAILSAHSGEIEVQPINR